MIDLGGGVGARNREDLVVVRFARDQFGDPVPTSYTEHVLPGCLVAPGLSSEDVASGEDVTTRPTVYARPDADVVATDRLRRPSDPVPAPGAAARVRGPWQVVGDPQRWTPGTVVAIERAAGS